MTSRLLLSVVVLLLSSASLLAQQGTDTRTPLAGLRHGANPDTNASFALGLIRPGDLAFRQSAYTGDALTVSGQVQPEAAQVGKRSDIFAVVRVGAAFYVIDVNQRLLPWDGRVASLVPRYTDVVLKSREDFVLYDGAIAQAGEYRFFVGYMPQDTGALYYTGTPQLMRIDAAPAPVGKCSTYGGRTVPVWHTSATGIFTHTPFAASDLNLITNGKETNDPRFSYQWVKSAPGQAQVPPINIYAPADGVLIRLRHKARNLPEFDGDDYDMFLLVACDPARPDKTAIVRFNHITEPRADIKAAFVGGELGAPTFKPVFDEREDLQVPTTKIVVRAGDYLGRTSGTPVAHDFDFMIAIDDVSLCPFSVLAEPFKTQLLSKLGPQAASPYGPPPLAGYPCEGYGMRP